MSHDIDLDLEDDDGTPDNEYVASFVWCDGHLSASLYNTKSFELKITMETIDLRPDFVHTKNIFSGIRIRSVLASGPHVFLVKIMQLLGMDEQIDPDTYRVQKIKSLSAATFIVCISNDNTLISNRKRILECNLPGMANTVHDQERFNFIETSLPLHQSLVVHSLGNLLTYLDINWKHLFLMRDNRVIINGLSMYRLEDDIMIDEATFHAMQIFSADDHPSAFKKTTKENISENGLSIYGIMNTCASRLGSNLLKTWLYQPTQQLNALKSRYRMIVWCRNERNAVTLTKFRSSLKKISNTAELYSKLVRTRGKPTLWRALKRSLYYAHDVGTICMTLMKANSADAADVTGTIIEELGEFCDVNTELYGLLKKLDMIIDMDESVSSGKFCIRYGLDEELDAKKTQLRKQIEAMQAKLRAEFANENLPDIFNEVNLFHFHEMGFLIAIPAKGHSRPPIHPKLHFKFKSKHSFHYTSDICTELSATYGDLYIDICEREQRICEQLLDLVYDKLSPIQQAINLCAKLDCLLSMASFSQRYNLVEPELISEGKVLDIQGGRHLLLDLHKKFVANDASVNVNDKNLINVIIAPNASGKSVYLKELAQITYLAHIGSFVPAERAKMSIVDAIYTRIYTPESLYLGKSSFLIEIQQMSNVIMNSTSKALILIDEMGQGTNELNGKSLLLACLEDLANRKELSPITFIITHYVDVYDILIDMEWISLKTFEMIEASDGSLESTYKLIEGKCAERYVKNCPIVQRFFQHIQRGQKNNDKDDSKSEAGTSTKTNQSNNNNSSLHIANEVVNSKIQCAATILYKFLTASPDEEVDYVEIFENWTV